MHACEDSHLLPLSSSFASQLVVFLSRSHPPNINEIVPVKLRLHTAQPAVRRHQRLFPLFPSFDYFTNINCPPTFSREVDSNPFPRPIAPVAISWDRAGHEVEGLQDSPSADIDLFRGPTTTPLQWTRTSVPTAGYGKPQSITAVAFDSTVVAAEA